MVHMATLSAPVIPELELRMAFLKLTGDSNALPNAISKQAGSPGDA